jgi:hypothetical protein
VIDRVWGRGAIEPDRAHLRETHAGVPVVYLVEGSISGFALCGTWLVADIPAAERDRFAECARCLRIADEIDRGETPEPGWSAHQ